MLDLEVAHLHFQDLLRLLRQNVLQERRWRLSSGNKDEDERLKESVESPPQEDCSQLTVKAFLAEQNQPSLPTLD